MISKPVAKGMSRCVPGALPSMLLVLILGGCSRTPNDSRAPLALKDPILQERLAKDAGFKSDKESPIPEQTRPGFRGLAYYPINPDLRFSAKLQRYPSPKPIKLATNTGEIRRGLRYGYFDFRVGAQACRLQVYRVEDGADGRASLFIPFRDSTSGKDTYAAGRYIDLRENTSGIYDLDFNRAYNPYCAYNSEFSCPIPPAENTLNVPIQAGEKRYISGTEH